MSRHIFNLTSQFFIDTISATDKKLRRDVAQVSGKFLKSINSCENCINRMICKWRRRRCESYIRG